MTNRRLPPIETLDDILQGVEFMERNRFVEETFFPDDFKNKAVFYDVHKEFKANQERLFLNEEGKSYFEVEMSRDGDIISHIDLGCSSGRSSLKLGSLLLDSNKRVVHCASIYTHIKLVITLEDGHNMENPIFVSWKTTVLMDNDLRNRVMHANLECDGIRYLNGMALI
ncbi:MAG: hypothetical protein EB127_18395 [Alphaproteobacteria bacterium]|nr:hypothetical protein [Alphaproteobacteria bacterium]